MSENGVDLGQIAAMLYTVIQAQAETNRRLDRVEGEVRSEFAVFRSEFAAVRKEMREGFASVRDEVRFYNGVLSGHGMLISDLDERVGKLEGGADPARAA